MSENPADHDEQEEPRIVTNEGATLTFERVWIQCEGWACGVKRESDTVYRYPPHRVDMVVDTL